MPDRYAVIGHPVDHSLSPVIHAAFARATGEDISYGRIHAPLDGFRQAALDFRDEGGRGLNVTLPFKHDAWRLADDHIGHTLGAEAVNTLEFTEEKIVGYNTDGIGLVRDLKGNLNRALEGKSVLVMGAGGASYGIVQPLLRERARLTIVNRTLARAQKLVAHFECVLGSMSGIAWRSYDRLQNDHFDIVVNATSAGLADAMPPLPDDVFAPGALAYDMVYGRETPFMRFALERGAQAVDGLGMLVEQAAESFFLWRGVRPATAPVIEALRMKDEG